MTTQSFNVDYCPDNENFLIIFEKNQKQAVCSCGKFKGILELEEKCPNCGATDVVRFKEAIYNHTRQSVKEYSVIQKVKATADELNIKIMNMDINIGEAEHGDPEFSVDFEPIDIEMSYITKKDKETLKVDFYKNGEVEA